MASHIIFNFSLTLLSLSSRATARLLSILSTYLRTSADCHVLGVSPLRPLEAIFPSHFLLAFTFPLCLRERSPIPPGTPIRLRSLASQQFTVRSDSYSLPSPAPTRLPPRPPKPCQRYEAVLELAELPAGSAAQIADNLHTGATDKRTLATQTVTTSCSACEETAATCLFAEAGACHRHACAQWQRWTLVAPAQVSQNSTLIWRLSELQPYAGDAQQKSAKQRPVLVASTPVIGVAPAAENQGGVSSLPVNPRMRMRHPMVQYAFRTLMAQRAEDSGDASGARTTTAAPSSKTKETTSGDTNVICKCDSPCVAVQFSDQGVRGA